MAYCRTLIPIAHGASPSELLAPLLERLGLGHQLLGLGHLGCGAMRRCRKTPAHFLGCELEHAMRLAGQRGLRLLALDRKSTRLNSSHT